MLFGRTRKRFFHPQIVAITCFALVLFLPFISPAQRLPIKTYTVGDGLAHNNINRLVQDAKGFLWIATSEGLSRFDGYGFTNYGTNDGLNHIFVNDIAVDREGNLWTATNGGGVSRLLDEPNENETSAARKKFVSFAIADGGEPNGANLVNRILFDAENRLWCLTDSGLYRAKQIAVAERDFERVIAAPTKPALLTAHAAFADSRGRFWFSINAQAVEFAGGKRFDYEPYLEVNKSAAETPADLNLDAFAEDENGYIFASDPQSVYEFIEPETEGGRGSWRKLSFERQPSQYLRTIAPATNGGLWIGTLSGLMHYGDGRETLYTTANGLSVNDVTAVFPDREGNVWIGTRGGGVNKLTSETIVSYTVAEGLPFSDVYRFIADRDGTLYAQTGCEPQKIVRIGADKVSVIHNSELKKGRCYNMHLLQDSQRRWWFSTSYGLWVSADAPALDFKNGRLLTAADNGLPESAAAEMYQDADGKVWLVNIDSGNIVMADAKLPGTPHFEIVAQNVPAQRILSDAGGTIWLAGRDNLWRIRNGQTIEIKSIENLPRIEPRCLFEDSRGRVWIGTRYNGAIVTDEPEAENPRFVNYTPADGLTSGAVWTISEDDQGKIYLGTGRGVDQLDTTTNKIRHFTNDEGVIGSVINHLLKDKQGNIWVATDLGISRINPNTVRIETKPPPILIDRVLIAGEELPLAETGVSALTAPDFSANQNNISIHFVGLSFQKENALRYEYKLEGADDDWSAASRQREVAFANLGAGNYRFLVRAINSEDTRSEQPAVFAFQILRPVWQRWWFVLAAILIFGGMIRFIYRRRVSRLLEMERVRTRIATDLHDDIGANLTKIAILSEVAKQQSGQNSSGNGKDNLLGSVAEISRESISAMGDIVWAINPKKDSLIGLTRRMRQHAEEILQQRDISLEFDAPVVEADIKLDADIRRNVYLIFKEAVNNIIRHSNAAAVRIDFALVDKELILQISDDGKGFDKAREYDGNGLLNIKKRAEDCGGQLEIDSTANAGTKIVLRLKLKSAVWVWR